LKKHELKEMESTQSDIASFENLQFYRSQTKPFIISLFAVQGV